MGAPAEIAAASRRASRVETDSLGRVEVPVDALYGARTARAVDNLSFSGRILGDCTVYLAALGSVKRAAARANREADVLQPEVAAAIEVAASRIADTDMRPHFPVDLLGGGGSIGIHINVNEVVANLANEARGGRRGEYAPVRPADVGASQSTADVCHTALRVAILCEWPRLRTTLDALESAISRKAAELAGVETMARTCLRDAMPVSLDVLFGGYAALLTRRTQELQGCIDKLYAVSLGGTVIGTSEGAPVLYRDRVVPVLAEIVGLALVSRECRSDALQNSDDVAAISSQLRLLAEALMKVGADLRLLSSGPRGGFGELELPVVQEGSSFFAGKSNPVVPETVIQCAFQVLGCDRAVQAANEHAELYLNVFDGLAAVNVLDSLRMLTQAVALLDTRCLRELRANVERCAELSQLTGRK